MIGYKKQVDPRYIDRLIFEAKMEVEKIHGHLTWNFEKIENPNGDKNTHDVYISATRAGGNINVRFRIEPKQLIGEDLRILANKMAGFL